MKASRSVASRLDTEFGMVLIGMVRTTPGACAAVLSDDNGDAIDFAHDPNRIGEIDVQLLGAQTGQAALRVDTCGERRGMRAPLCLLETQRGALLVSAVARSYVLCLLLEPRANLARAIRVFTGGRRRIGTLLRT